MAVLPFMLPFSVLAQSSTAATQWPKEVQAIFEEYKTQCQQAGGKFVPDRANFARQIEVTGDGKPDWVVEQSAFACKVSQAQMDAGNVPDTGSGFCGTAGCQIIILGSGRKGLAPIFEGLLRNVTPVDLGGGRKGIETSVHGTACGGAGAEVCIETLAWNGKKWTVVKRYRWTDADYEAQQQSQAALLPVEEFRNHEAKWTFSGRPSSAVAEIRDHPELGKLSLTCRPEGGIDLAVTPGQTSMPFPPAGQPLLLWFEGSMDGTVADQPLAQVPGKAGWSGPLAPELEALLGGSDDGLTLLVSIDGGAEWQELAYVSLAGSTKALRSLQTQCPASKRPDPSIAAAGTALKPSDLSVGTPDSAAAAARIPLAVGYYAYVEGTFSTCANPVITPWYFDGTRFWEETDITDPKHEYSSQAVAWEMAGRDRFRISYRNRDEDGRWSPGVTINEYLITGPRSFTFVGVVGSSMRASEKQQFCTAAQLPAKSLWYKVAK
jgi:hypothetical protein